MNMGLRNWLLSVAVALLALPGIGKAETISLLNAGDSGAATGAIGGLYRAYQVSPQPTGTGVIDSFLRVAANSSDNAMSTKGYNTDANVEFNAKPGPFTRSLLLTDVTKVVRFGVMYREFLLDINQLGGDPLLSLNQVQIFQTNNANLSNANLDPEGSGQAAIVSFAAGAANEIFRMSGIGTANQDEIILNYNLNPGSGGGDMLLYIEDSLFNSSMTYVTLFSQFGTPPGANDNNDGYEEWAILSGGGAIRPPDRVVVPAPAGVLLFGMGALLTAGFRLRRNRKVSVAI